MACTVVIQNVLGQGELGSLATSLKVAGVATGCERVNVSIACTGHAITHANVRVAGRQWQTVFDRQELKTAGCEECNSSAYPITVRAHCTDAGSDCSDARVYPDIPCKTGCPTIESIDADVPACGELAPTRGYNVTFAAPIVGGNVGACVWSFGDGTDPVVGGSPAEGVAIAQHTYECAGAYPVSLTILSDCEPNYSDSEVLQLDLRPPDGQRFRGPGGRFEPLSLEVRGQDRAALRRMHRELSLELRRRPGGEDRRTGRRACLLGGRAAHGDAHGRGRGCAAGRRTLLRDAGDSGLRLQVGRRRKREAAPLVGPAWLGSTVHGRINLRELVGVPMSGVAERG